SATPVDVTIDTAAPATPAITTADATKVAGTAEPGTTVKVTWPDNTTSTATADPQGNWSVTTPDGMTSGDVTAVSTDPAGNDSAPATTYLNLDAPDAPLIKTANATAVTGTVPLPVEAGTTLTLTYPTTDGWATVTADVDPATGAWSLATPAAAVSGPLSAVVTDPEGVDSSAGTGSLDVDAPAAPHVDSPADGAAINNARPTVTGTGEPGAAVTVQDKAGHGLCTATVGATGAWSCTVPAGQALTEGPAELVVTQTDKAGNVSGPATDDLTVDLTAPAAPTVTGPLSGVATNDPTPTVTGTGEPGAAVTVADKAGNVLCAATVAADGSWSCTVGRPLPDGTDELTVAQTDAAGNESGPTVVKPVVDTAAPAVPTVTGPTTGEEIDTLEPTVAGKGEPGAAVTVTDKAGNVLCTTTVAADGSWSCTVGRPLPNGTDELDVRQTDAAGNTSGPAVVDPVVDTVAPAAPVVVSPQDGPTKDSAPTITGQGEPAATVTVADGHGNVLCQATVAADGSWSCTVTTALPDGTDKLTVTQTDQAGNESAPTMARPVVDTVPPAQPVVTEADAVVVSGTAEPGATVLVTWPDGTTVTADVDDAGNWSVPTPGTMMSGDVQVVAVDAAGNPSQPVETFLDLNPGAPAITTANASEIAGTAEPGAVVTVTYPVVDPTTGAVVTATADPVIVGPDGTWSIITPPDAVSGEVTVVATDQNGNRSLPGETHLDATAPAAPVVDTPTVGLPVKDRAPEVSGQGEVGATVTVADKAGDVLCQTVVLPDGSWSCTVGQALPEGTAELDVTQTDPAGNPSDPTVVAITVDTTAPAVPAIETANAQVVAGTAEPGSTVTVTYPRADGTTGTVTGAVDETGHWSIPTPADAADGKITAVATDPAGNTSGEATRTLDSTPPAAPQVNPSTGGEISGTAEPGDTVTISQHGVAVPGCETVTADADGLFVCPPTTPLGPGDKVEVTVTDSAGNESQPTVIEIGQLAVEVAYPTRHIKETQVVTGSNFAPGEMVCLTLHSTDIALGCKTAEDGGKVTFSFTVPDGIELGEHALTLTGNHSGAIAVTFTVTKAPAAPTGGTVHPPMGLLPFGVVTVAAGLWITRQGVQARKGKKWSSG
ncbi:MAG: Ig-like domain-containing protein, partial [Propionibacteriaceae bacterium]|nr:Ig-like domain-containing protein [Propionibacteriaceae bacterium]